MSNSFIVECGHASVCWGVKSEWLTCPILGVPDGATVVRRRLRNRSIGHAYVRHDNGSLVRHYLELAEGGLKLGHPVGANRKEHHG